MVWIHVDYYTIRNHTGSLPLEPQIHKSFRNLCGAEKNREREREGGKNEERTDGIVIECNMYGVSRNQCTRFYSKKDRAATGKSTSLFCIIQYFRYGVYTWSPGLTDFSCIILKTLIFFVVNLISLENIKHQTFLLTK